ncbi:MAG TPA: zinc-dependent metalloprotease [Streptosporangiaceae bacterium]|nr:zinc-dependent metalloprotease [Streptosporangiaceae bacterium]
MSEPPFGFGLPDKPGDDSGHGSGGSSGRSGGSGGGSGAGGPGGPADPGGPFGDPQQFADALRQFADAMTYQGGPVNWDLAKNTARQTIVAKGDPSVLNNQRAAVVDAVRLADLWLEDATSLPSGIRTIEAWSRSEWVEATMPVWQTLCQPIAERAVDSMGSMFSVSETDLGDLPPEMQSAMAALTGGAGPGALAGALSGMGEMMRRMGGMMVGGQAGAAVGTLAEDIISSSDIGLPLGPEGTAALLPAGVTQFGSGLSVSEDEVRLFVAMREAAHQRLFSHVPWLRARLLGAVEDYARGIKVDPDSLRDAMQQIDLENPEAAMNEAMSGAATFQPEDTPEQKAALSRLETLLALVEGWVATVVADAARDRLPDAEALAEAIRRRRATGGPAERTFATLVGLELRPRRLREAATVWRTLTEDRGISGRDQIWEHPDLLPSAEDLEDPEGFVRGRPELDLSDLSDLSSLTQEEQPGGTPGAGGAEPESGSGPAEETGPDDDGGEPDKGRDTDT